MGCTIVEKHVGVPTDTISLNAYSNTPEQMKKAILEIQRTEAALSGVSTTEKEALSALKRGVYLKTNVKEGHIFTEEDFYYAMPCQDNQYNASNVPDLVGTLATKELFVNAPLDKSSNRTTLDDNIVNRIVKQSIRVLSEAKIPMSGK